LKDLWKINGYEISDLLNKKYKELIIGTTVGKNNITLDPFQTIWLSN